MGYKKINGISCLLIDSNDTTTYPRVKFGGYEVAATKVNAIDNTKIGMYIKKDNEYFYVTKTTCRVNGVPSQSGTLTYDGNAKTPEWMSYDDMHLILTNFQAEINAGTYSATFTPVEGYVWQDETDDPITISWTINKADDSIRLSKDNISLTKSHNTDVITANHSSNSAISALSSDTDVVTTTINNNIITFTGHKTGSSNVTISALGDNNYNAPSSVTLGVNVDFQVLLTIAGTTNQIITLTYTEPDSSPVTVTSISSDQNFTVEYGTTWTATVAGAEGYNAGTLSASSGTITGNTTVSASEATIAIIILTDSNYEMSQLYPSIYHTMIIVPDKLNSSNLTTTKEMFVRCDNLTTIPQLDTSKVTNMYCMFYECSSLTSIPQLDTSSVTNMGSMFYDCNKLTGNEDIFKNLNTSKVTSMKEMFFNCTKLTSIPQLDTNNVTNMYRMFYYCTSLPSEFPWIIDCSSIINTNRISDMFKDSSVTKVTLANVNNSIRSQITSQLLKGDNTLTIIFA